MEFEARTSDLVSMVADHCQAQGLDYLPAFLETFGTMVADELSARGEVELTPERGAERSRGGVAGLPD
jgi:hypothetical protein